MLEPKTIRPKLTTLLVSGSVCTLVAVILSGGYRFMDSGDFLIQDKVSCDSSTVSCFQEELESGTNIFKVIQIKGFSAPVCDGWKEDGCPELTCVGISSNNCKEYLCSEATIEELGIDATCIKDVQ